MPGGQGSLSQGGRGQLIGAGNVGGEAAARRQGILRKEHLTKESERHPVGGGVIKAGQGQDQMAVSGAERGSQFAGRGEIEAGRGKIEAHWEAEA